MTAAVSRPAHEIVSPREVGRRLGKSYFFVLRRLPTWNAESSGRILVQLGAKDAKCPRFGIRWQRLIAHLGFIEEVPDGDVGEVRALVESLEDRMAAVETRVDGAFQVLDQAAIVQKGHRTRLEQLERRGPAQG